MQLHPVLPAELPAVAEAFQATFNSSPWDEHWTPDTALAVLSDLLHTPRASALATWEGSRCVGAVLGRDHVSDTGLSHTIQEMFVRPERQRGGIGHALLDAYLEAVKERGIITVSLLTARDSAAEQFYARSGFRRAQRMVLLVRP